MQYLITFLEGIITFISPCVLPMLPLYALYFAGGAGNRRSPLRNALGFVLGFTLLFVLLGMLAGTLGGFLTRHRTAVNLATGAIVVLFGLHYAGLLHIRLLDRTVKPSADIRPERFFAAVLFGAVFAVGWSPCTGAFLGSAMMLAASRQSSMAGLFLLLCYSAGLGIPFVLSAVLIDRLQSAFRFIREHYRVINLVCGIFLIVIGILMMTGLFDSAAALLS
ncbi:MAG: cytochrome c biogenesis protein CcdA [Oscillospiraceae bacterium]|nr:cytochrome c biogenesis protein CcdA [Oscillospiraceae bacterium]